MNKRLTDLKKKLMDSAHTKKEYWGYDLTIFDKPGLEKLPVITRKAMAFDLVCEKIPVQIGSGELIVGAMTMASIAFGGNFPKYETEEDLAKVKKWGLTAKSVFGHHLPYYPKVLSKGYKGIIADIDRELSDIAGKSDKQRQFLEAARATLESAAKVSERYASLADELAAAETDEARKAELLEIARICRKVPMEPADTFYEALQSLWLVHMLLHSTLSMTPLGRVDQYLFPYYERDIKSGRLTREKAQELVSCFMIKFNERLQFYKYEDGIPNPSALNVDNDQNEEYTFAQNGNHWLQTITLSGKAMDGSDMTNDLSYIFLHAVNELELVSPMVNARLHRNSPAEWIDFIGDALCDGGAQPVVFNDEVLIRGLIDHQHIPPEDAYEYASDGCWEAVIYGKVDYEFDYSQLLYCIEEVINQGHLLLDPASAELEPDGSLAALDTYEKFYGAVIDRVRHSINSKVQEWTERRAHVHEIAPEPFLSSFVLDCIENGRDLTDYGARYHQFSVLAVGLSHCVDSLCAVKKLVYDKQVVTLETYADALKKNWEGYEELRLLALNHTPKYGNDDPESNDVLVRLMDDFCTEVERLNSMSDVMIYTPGVATFELYPTFGQRTGASFDGRFAHEALSSNFSPAVGRDKEGPTAALLSSARFDMARMSSGGPVDMCLTFGKEDRAHNAKVLSGLIKGFIDINGSMLTLSRVDLETLKKAQKHPEDYQSLRVRLGGVTAYFVQLAHQQQEEYMRRTEHCI